MRRIVAERIVTEEGVGLPSGPVFLPLSGIVTACCLMASGRLIMAGATVTRTGTPQSDMFRKGTYGCWTKCQGATGEPAERCRKAGW